MKHRKHTPAGDGPPFVDPLFASELLESELESGRGGGRRGRHRASRGAREQRKTAQLCRQVYQALTLALPGAGGDEVLGELTVESVTPAPNASRLLVTVALPPPRRGEAAPSPQQVLERLARHHGRLRGAVAAAITRKRAPELTFLPVLSGGAGEGAVRP